jgi:ABC-type Zn2+ transport system substrate-binding protein/surface adhesin
MSSESCLTSKLNDKIIKLPSKSHETIPLNHCERCKKIRETNQPKNTNTALLWPKPFIIFMPAYKYMHIN